MLLESSESNLFALQRELSSPRMQSAATFILGSVADSALLDEIFSIHVPRMVFHAAAFKQVPLMEEQPLAAIANNVFGTATLAAAATGHGARVILLSTDKAVEPASVMGATKRIAEQIVLSKRGTVVRLCNVLASRDSVAEVFARQIADGGPITVTDPAVRRYFLTIDEAVDLLLLAASDPRLPALMAPHLPVQHFIADLAQFMARTLAPGRDIPIHFTRLRAGDKESEQLWSSTEEATPTEMPGICSISSSVPDPLALESRLEALRAAVEARDIPASIDCICALVPDYTPSHSVRALGVDAISRVSHE